MYGCESSNTGEVEPIPKQCQFASDVQFITQVNQLFSSLLQPTHVVNIYYTPRKQSLGGI